MHPLIEIPELEKLTDGELILLEARLREIVLNHDLTYADLRRLLCSLSNAVYVRSLRTPLSPLSGRISAKISVWT